MDPITIGLIATSALGKLGGIFGAKKRKQLDPNQLQQMFGAKAITDEQMQLFNRAMGSAQGQQLMTSAAQQGQQFQTDVAKRSAEAGLGPAGGASGGADIFAGAAADSAVGNLQLGMRSNLMQAMLPVAQQLVSDRMQAWLSDRDKFLGQTSRFQDVMGAVGGLSDSLMAKRAQNPGQPGQDQQVAQDPTWNGPPPPPNIAPGAPPAPTPTSMVPGQPPAGAVPSAVNQPMGTQAMTQPASDLGMADPMATGMLMPGMKQRKLQPFMGGGRFARAMGSNRFGAVQPAL